MSIDKQLLPDAQASAAAAESGFGLDGQSPTVKQAVQDYVDRVRGGDMGPLPAILGLVVLSIVFTVLQPDTFPSPGNIANLLTQAGAVCVLAMGLVPVLLLGDIDLSAGVAGGVSAGVMAILVDQKGFHWTLAILAAVVTGIVIGTVIGFLVSKVGIPSFVVTLAFFLGLQGVTLRLIGEGGTVPVRDSVIVGIANSNLSVWLGWTLAVVAIVLFAASELWRHRSRVAQNLQHQPLALVIAKIVVIAAVAIAVVGILSVNRARIGELRGVPYVVPIVILLLVFWTFVFARTAFGRHVYAVGGNKEAARRAGINVNRVRIAVFAICSGMAALSGIIAASRLNSVTPDAGAGNTLLYAVGAAVIGGTSLFGGRGKIRDAVIGGVVIALIDNGLLLMDFPAYANYLVTGGVLLLAAGVDAVSRNRRSSAGV